MDSNKSAGQRIVKWVLIGCAVMLARYVVDGPLPTPTPTPPVAYEKQEKALAYLQKKMPVLREIMWSGGNTLYASVFLRQGSGDGYAMTTCEYLRDVGADQGVTVRILDASDAAAHKLTQIGKHRCGHKREE